MKPESVEKKLAIEEYMDGHQAIALIGIFTAMPGVILPQFLMEDTTAAVNLSWGFNHPVLNFDENGIEVLLSFSQRGFLCFIPWESIIRVSCGDGSDPRTWHISTAVEPNKEDGIYVPLIPRESMSRDRAVRTVHMLMMQLGSLEGTDTVRFELAPLPRSAYTGLKLVTRNEPTVVPGSDPEPESPQVA